MVRKRVNFGDVEDFEALPEGVYEAVIEKIEYREAKEKGKAPYLNVEYTVVEPEEFAGRKIWEVLSWSPKALFRMRDFFEAAGFGWDDDDDHEMDIDEESNLLIEPDLTGEAVTLTVENEIYNKKEVNRVVVTEFANPPGGDEDEDGEEEEPAPKKKATSKKKAAPAVEEDDDDEDEEEEDDSDEDDDEEEDEEEEEEAPPPKKKVATSKKPAATAKASPAKRGPAGAKKRTFR